MNPSDPDMDFVLSVLDTGKKIRDLYEGHKALITEMQNRAMTTAQIAMVKAAFVKAIGMAMFSLENQFRQYGGERPPTTPFQTSPSPAPKKTIVPVAIAGDCRTGSLSETSIREITSILGFTPNVKDGDAKVKASWGFMVDGVRCGIWDYKGSYRDGYFSTFGPHHLLVHLFGAKYRGG